MVINFYHYASGAHIFTFSTDAESIGVGAGDIVYHCEQAMRVVGVDYEDEDDLEQMGIACRPIGDDEIT